MLLSAWNWVVLANWLSHLVTAFCGNNHNRVHSNSCYMYCSSYSNSIALITFCDTSHSVYKQCLTHCLHKVSDTVSTHSVYTQCLTQCLHSVLHSVWHSVYTVSYTQCLTQCLHTVSDTQCLTQCLHTVSYTQCLHTESDTQCLTHSAWHSIYTQHIFSPPEIISLQSRIFTPTFRPPCWGGRFPVPEFPCRKTPAGNGMYSPLCFLLQMQGWDRCEGWITHHSLSPGHN